MVKSFIESSLQQRDTSFEVPLRPQCLDDFIGQNLIRDRLEVLIGAAKQRGEQLSHCLFSGPPGLGKTTLAGILAKAMGTQLIVTSGPIIEKAGDLAGILTNLNRGDVLFIDEIHRLNRTVEEYLYRAMEDFALDLVIDSGPNSRSIEMKLNPFTLAAATTRLGLLSEPLRTRFGFTCRLDYYDAFTLRKVVERTARLLNLNLGEEAALAIAERSRGTPRMANHLLRWVRDFAQMRTNHHIDHQVVDQALHLLAIDAKGLDEMDKKMLKIIEEHYQGGPVGLKALAALMNEEPSTIEEVYEPYLLLLGFLRRTPQGREITDLGRDHLKF